MTIKFNLNISLSDLINFVGDEEGDAKNVVVFYKYQHHEMVYTEWIEICRNDIDGDNQLCWGSTCGFSNVLYAEFSTDKELISKMKERRITILGWIPLEIYALSFDTTQ